MVYLLPFVLLSRRFTIGFQAIYLGIAALFVRLSDSGSKAMVKAR